MSPSVFRKLRWPPPWSSATRARWYYFICSAMRGKKYQVLEPFQSDQLWLVKRHGDGDPAHV